MHTMQLARIVGDGEVRMTVKRSCKFGSQKATLMHMYLHKARVAAVWSCTSAKLCGLFTTVEIIGA